MWGGLFCGAVIGRGLGVGGFGGLDVFFCGIVGVRK